MLKESVFKNVIKLKIVKKKTSNKVFMIVENYSSNFDKGFVRFVFVISDFYCKDLN